MCIVSIHSLVRSSACRLGIGPRSDLLVILYPSKSSKCDLRICQGRLGSRSVFGAGKGYICRPIAAPATSQEPGGERHRQAHAEGIHGC